jgi:hypothetical protein
MANFIASLTVCGVRDALSMLKLDFAELFERRLDQGNRHAYDQHLWSVKEVPGYGRVVNAAPRRTHREELPWEEWFRKEGKTHHRVLTLRRPPRWDDVFVAPEHDDVHPSSTFGRTWYIVDDPDMTPLFLRRHGRPAL